MFNSVTWQKVILVCLLAFLPACSGVSGKKVSRAMIMDVREGMKERDVVGVLGRPDRTKTQYFKDGEHSQLKSLYYTLDDGGKWVIVLNEHDETIGSGEPAGPVVSRSGGALSEFQRSFSKK